MPKGVVYAMCSLTSLCQEMDRYSLQESIGADNEETETSDGGPPSDSITDPVITPPPPPDTFQRKSYIIGERK